MLYCRKNSHCSQYSQNQIFIKYCLHNFSHQFTIITACLIRLTFSSNIIFFLKAYPSKKMSQVNASPNPKCEIKPSLKKSNKADHSKTKKIIIDENGDSKNMSQLKNDQNIQEKIDPKLQSKSSKKAALQFKGQAQFKEQVIQAVKSEKSAKMMKSSDRNTTIRENHNNIESNKRQFSHSKQEDEHLEVSIKKINTESKKSKIVETGSKHSKTEEKTLNINQVKDQKQCTQVNGQIQKPNQPEIIKNELLPSEIPPNPKEDQQNVKINTKTEIAKGSQQNPKDTKMSKNFKRSEISKNSKETGQNIKDLNKSKSSKQSLPRSQATSKDSKMMMNKKNGEKKPKLNERWH